MRYIKRIETDDIKDAYNPENTITITLPRQKLDLHTFTLYYTGTANEAEVALISLKRFFPRLSQSIVSTLIIEIDGRQVQKIDEFGYLYNILHDVSRHDEDVNGTQFDTIAKHRVASDTGIITKNVKLQADGIANSSESFYIDKWLGFLNQGQRYIDCTDKDIKIRIKLAPSSILYKGVNTNGVAIGGAQERNYTLTDVYATIDILDTIPEPVGSNKFVDYMTVLGFPKTDNKKTSVSFQCNKPISWMLGTFTSPSRTTDSELLLMHCNSQLSGTTSIYGNQILPTVATAAALLDAQTSFKPLQYYYSYDIARQWKLPYLLNNSIYYQRSGKGILNCVFNVNGYDITPKLSLLGCYKESKKCFNSEYKRVLSLASFENDFFCNAIRLDDDTNDVKRVEWNVDTDPAKYQEGGQPIVFVCTESSY